MKLDDATQAKLRHLQEQKIVAKSIMLDRMSKDPLWNFSPTPKQIPFIDSVLNKTHLENWFIAANRSGKSDAGAYCGAHLARYGDQSDEVKWVGGKGSTTQVRDRSTSGWVSALDFPTSRDTIQPKYFDNGFVPPGSGHEPFIPKHEIEEWRVSDQVLRLKRGSIIGFKSAEQGSSKYQGAEKDWIHFDEEHPKLVYNEATIRVGTRPLRLINTCTLLPPQGQVGGVTWVFGDIIQAVRDGKRPDVGIFGSSIYDNPHIPESEIRRLEARYPEGSTERRIRLNGEMLPGLSGSRAYAAFDRRLHVRVQPEINLRRPLAWIHDFNVEPYITHIGQVEVVGGKKLFRIFHQLVLESSGSIDEMCELFYTMHRVHMAEVWIYGDATEKGRSTQTGKSSYTLILNKMRGYGAPFRLKVPESNPPVPDRINAMNVAMLDENGQVCLECDPLCEEFIKDCEEVLKGPTGGIKKTTNRKDPYFWRTHATDGIGYWVWYEAPVTASALDDHTRKLILPTPGYSRRIR